jgi:hypothetical protein
MATKDHWLRFSGPLQSNLPPTLLTLPKATAQAIPQLSTTRDQSLGDGWRVLICLPTKHRAQLKQCVGYVRKAMPSCPDDFRNAGPWQL